jgi:hypothetical protein
MSDLHLPYFSLSLNSRVERERLLLIIPILSPVTNTDPGTKSSSSFSCMIQLILSGQRRVSRTKKKMNESDKDSAQHMEAGFSFLAFNLK